MKMASRSIDLIIKKQISRAARESLLAAYGTQIVSIIFARRFNRN